VTVFHLHGDAAGDTHVTVLDLPTNETQAGVVRGLSEIPATTTGFGEFVERKPDVGVHNAPRRQFLVVLKGVLEIVTTLDQRERLQPGDVLLADDTETKGHISRDVGEEPLALLAIGIADGWELPR
jgi:quercetin dioxygenase-like cupin family protein